jgi:hypothetical protein
MLTHGRAGENFSGPGDGDFARDYIYRHFVPGPYPGADAGAGNKGQPQVYGVPEKYAGKGFGHDNPRAHLDKRDGRVFPAGAAAKVGSRGDDAPFRKTVRDSRVHPKKAALSNFPGIYDFQKAPGKNLIRIDIFAQYQGLAAELCLHDTPSIKSGGIAACVKPDINAKRS